MARFIGIDRVNKRVVEYNSLDGTIANIGAAIANIESSSLFPARTQNIAIIYRGDIYIIVRRTDGLIGVFQYDGVSWNDVFQSAANAGGGQLMPIGIHVVNDTLVALFMEGSSPAGASQRIIASESTDGTSWSIEYDMSIAAHTSEAGHSIVWNNSILFTTTEGISYFLPGSGFPVAVPYDGDDSGLIQNETTAGCFAIWQGFLYFILPSSPSPKIYRLNPSFDPVTAPISNQFFNQNATGFTDPGAITVDSDSGMYSLFVTPDNELAAFYTGALGTFYATSSIDAFPAFSDQASITFPVGVSSLTNARLSMIYDERRNSRQLPVLVVNDIATGDIRTVDLEGGVTVKNTNAAFGPLMLPQDQRTNRIYLEKQPAIIINSVTQVFPGNYDINYTLIDTSSRNIDIQPQYTINGTNWLDMTQGTTGEGKTSLSSSPAGSVHTFNWDTRQDLNGNIDFQNMRIVALIASV